MTDRESPDETNEHHRDVSQANERFEELLVGVRAGSEIAMQSFVDLTIDRVCAACEQRMERFKIRGIIGSDEIVNDIFKRFFEILKTGAFPWVRDLATFEKWVHLEIWQRTAKAYRAYRFDREHFPREADAKRDGQESPLVAAVDPISDVDDCDECEHLLKSLQCLPDELQVIARLHLVGSSQREIGLHLGLPPKAVSRKLNTIRRIWKQEDN